MSTSRPVWGADCPISMPVPSGDPILVPMFGFGMAQNRLVHDITQAEYESLAVPIYAPEIPPAAAVFDDLDIESAPARGERR